MAAVSVAVACVLHTTASGLCMLLCNQNIGLALLTAARVHDEQIMHHRQ
jgi:hypothetical protein